ncbi:hypothetical protein M983_2240 [Proteus myxofaciens ATCC 19692]|uniref:Uncharacterized protein n=1 Tax=Proteus myxofaciens ATCC 19692 TaxID=1354337 RepID=A0A198FMS8_9GAMM|nr:hypothetical protein M983_2240 [Proteus myxofaciens ATCC 19692]
MTKIIELNKGELNSNYWENFRKTSLKIPRYMKIFSKIGYANIGFGLWQSTNSTLQMIQSLLNEDLTLAQRKEIKTNLALMWSEMAYNGVSEFIEISIAKGMLRHKANPLDYAGKLSTRVGIALNILSVGFDIYNAYDNFSRIPEESNEKRRIDYIVNGSMAIVSGLITLGISIAMLAGSAIAGPIGIVAGVVIALATSIYNAARLIEDAKIKVHFTPWEELSNGFHVAFAGDFIPDKKNEIVLLETEKQLEELIDKNASNYFDEIKNINNFSYYFYSNEKQIYQEYYYYKVVPNLLGKTLDPIIDPVGNFITQRISTNMLQEEAENIAASSYHLRAEKTGYKYFHPKEAIATNEILIFDIDFYVNELKRYTIDIIPEKDFPIFHQEIDKDFLKGVKSTKANVLDILDTQDVLENGLVKASEYKKYYNRQWSGNEALHFSTYNGDDIIAAPCETYNTFDIYNGTKRLSGGNKEDMFNLFTSESPRYASRFYGRGGNDTLRVINTTNNHMGYEIDLSKNYVKFRNSPTQTNSQNFHSTLFLYKDNDQLYSTKITDSMPNVELQDNMVIAYLDSFENIIGSSDGCDLLVGNDSDNYIDGVSGNDSIYGLKGNDVIRLSQGEAFGGEGKDIYIIARIMESVINKEKIDITINEINTSTASSYAIERSLIKLEHNFINIKSIHRNGTDIILILDNGFIENKNKNINEEKLLLPSTSLCLKNVFVNSTSYDLVNKYDVITNDGFILNLNVQISDSADPLYYFSYMEDYSNLDDKVNTISLNEEQREFNIRTANSVVKHTILPALKYTGLSEGASLKLSIDGNDKDNAYLSIGDGSLISLTNGADLYHLKTFMAKNKESYIDVKITNNGLNNNTNNISSFVLPDVNGYDLKFDNGVIIHRYNPDEYMKLNIKIKDQQLNSNIKIKIIDKYGKMFSLPERNSNNNLLIPNVKERLDITSHDDSFTIPEEMTLNKKTMDMLNIPLSLLDSQSALFKILNSKVKLNIDLLPIIDLLQGNDILINKNKGCSILAGGEGDDTLIVEDGHHLLFANEGNDKLYGGHGNDVLVSEHGNDYLEGGEGDDIYLITKHRGEVIVNDTQGDNTLFILGLNGGEVMSHSRDGDDEILRSQEEDADFTVRIKDKYSANENNVSYQIELRDERLTSEAYASIIDAMAKFNETQLSSMKGTDLPAAPDWSLLPVITGYLG